MSISIARAAKRVTKYLSDQSDESKDVLRVSSARLPPAYREEYVYEDPQKRILPAFRETWRGGANIIAPNQGSCFVAVDCIWHDRNRISKEEIDKMNDSGNITKEKMPPSEEVPVCPRCKEDSLPVICSILPKERDIAGLLKRSRRDKAKLYRSCRNHYVHGALGLQESPYGHCGEVYQDIQQRLNTAYIHSRYPLKRQVQYQDDSLFGTYPLRESSPIRRKGGYPPRDHLFGPLHIKDLM
ncbi:uncharacterized protein TM35_000041780 [Trypanosoma theileri]|uniref:Uncharacterized protein n=1 Tax=Trypanosoma theileri TaxID=67003 RepID=A0A1X0P4U2_9TRYP|nr:uncharacterized protein TM35_000041780 [Trypanosoma theileri]ORC91964.1 hypothetical protein TM35_000041780 [Trypanosoma theileri]